MNKLVQYLNQHLSGEVTTDASLLAAYAKDGSPLSYAPQLVVTPRAVSDIRKMLRFSWQLAEKGYSMPVIARGGGTNKRGAAVGNGAVVAFAPYMHRLFEYDMKQQLLRLQPGAGVDSVQSALALQGARIPLDTDASGTAATLGGCVADDVRSLAWVRELEVVLANGDLLHTKRLSKRELGKKRGEQTFEGGIYRAIDKLFEEKAEVIAKLHEQSVAGYSTLAQVRDKDGSVDLTPLFVGSQGTLGLISEMIVRTEFIVPSRSVVVAAFASAAQLRDALDEVSKVTDTGVEYYHGEVVKRFVAAGRALPFGDNDVSGGMLRIVVSDRSSRSQARKLKRLTKVLEQHSGTVVVSDNVETGELANTQAVLALANHAIGKESHVANVSEGAWVPIERFEEYVQAIEELAQKRRVALLVSSSPLEGVWRVDVPLDLGTVGGKQAVVKLTEDIANLVYSFGGVNASAAAEGRLASSATYGGLDDDIIALFAEIRAIFDPHGFLNRGVKQPIELGELAKHLKSN